MRVYERMYTCLLYTSFLEAYIETEDIRQAALCAGYTAQSAFRMGQRALKNPEVRTQALWPVSYTHLARLWQGDRHGAAGRDLFAPAG